MIEPYEEDGRWYLQIAGSPIREDVTWWVKAFEVLDQRADAAPACPPERDTWPDNPAEIASFDTW